MSHGTSKNRGMRPLRDLTIKQKVVVITMMTIGLSLVLAGTGIVISDAILYLKIMRRDLRGLVNIVADNIVAPLQFEGKEEAEETLRTLKTRTHIEEACLFQKDG